MVEAPADPEPDGEPQAPDGSGVGGSGEGGYVVGIDTGGTFTDAVLVDSAGAVFFDKAFSTPGNPATGAREALANVCRTAGLDPADVLQQCVRFAHGTTVGTNALLQRRGARVALVLSKGFEDTVVISRGPLGKNTGIPLEQALDFIHNERPAPFVDRALTYGVAERVDLDGDVVAPLDEEEVRRILRSLSDHSADSLAVCLLWSFRNPTHERRVRELAHEVRPDLPVSLSSDVSPISGEYERTMTTVINAYVAPVLSRYIEDLSAALANDGLRYPVQLMSSSGGTVLPADVERRAVSLINGGPVGGLVAARELGRALGFTDAITTDMGGTSFDVGIIHGGAIVTEPSAFVAQGVPVQLEVARVETIGAGGGSIAWTDGDRLMVGPDSAGSDPGPACYGNGGREPTVTDALVVLGLLDPGAFFGGRRRLRPDLACEVIGERIGEPLGLSVDDAAAGIYEIVTSRMSDLIRQATVEAGLDPRAFTVVAFGGAAPLHAAAYAEPLGVREVIVPASSSVFSALGCALADIRYDYARSAPLRLQADAGADVDGLATRLFDELGGQARADLERAGRLEGATFQRAVDARYVGQMSELGVEVWQTEGFAAHVRAQFEAAYAARFGASTTRAQSPIELVTFRLRATAPTAARTADLVESGEASSGPSSEPRPSGRRAVRTRRHGPMDALVYDGMALRPDDRLAGPALVERPDTTIFVPPGSTAWIDRLGGLHLAPGG